MQSIQYWRPVWCNRKSVEQYHLNTDWVNNVITCDVFCKQLSKPNQINPALPWAGWKNVKCVQSSPTESLLIKTRGSCLSISTRIFSPLGPPIFPVYLIFMSCKYHIGQSLGMNIPEYAKFIWASPDILSGELPVLRQTIWILTRHFTANCPANIKLFTRHLFGEHCPWFTLAGPFVWRDKMPSPYIFQNLPDISGESGKFRVLW